MRFNKQELLTLATQPSQKFDKEGVLFVRERQDGFFRKTERKDSFKNGKRSNSLHELNCYGGTNKVSFERWCRLRGNLLFYFKTRDQWSEPIGVIVLEHCNIKVNQAPPIEGPFGFHIVFEGGQSHYLAAISEQERAHWLEAIQAAGYETTRSHLMLLQQRLELKKGHDPNLNVNMLRLRKGHCFDPSEVPLCEVALSCDNLLCDGHGRSPNPVLVARVYIPADAVWLKYANTEVVQKSSNPCFLSTISFRSSDGLSEESQVRITAYDVREFASLTSVPIGSACFRLSNLLDTSEHRLRIPFQNSSSSTVGFLSLLIYRLDKNLSKNPSTESTPCKSLPQQNLSLVYCHRRSQSLPPRLGSKLKLPKQGHLKELFANITMCTYRFHSGLGGDISTQEIMAESKLCFTFPQQLLGVWMSEEKELLQEVAGMGELVEPWHSRQVELLDRHLQLLSLYSQAKENLQAHKGSFFKPSSRKFDRSLEFAPINLHLQRLWAQNETLKKSNMYDTITVGAFTAHSHKSKNGGLVRLLQQLKELPLKSSSPSSTNKIAMADDAIQAIKELRREVVDAMRTLMKLAKQKKTIGMLPICEDMISKTRILLSLWDPYLVEEALSFIEEYKVTNIEDFMEGDDSLVSLSSMSPFHRITQQLNFNMKSPEVDDLATPDTPSAFRDVWNFSVSPLISNMNCKNVNGNNENINNVNNISQSGDNAQQFVIFPDAEEDNAHAVPDENSNLSNSSNNNIENDGNHKCNSTNGVENEIGRKFLDTHAMCNSPSANYYKPTDEPEPFDLTQLNIEASVMCLVSKVKFLCGRCGSPAVRLRSQKSINKSQSFRNKLSSQQLSSTKNDSEINVNTGTDSLEGQKNDSNNTNGDTIVKRNKFTEGLDFASITDWAVELRPSMRKLRQAMDGLLKTARLTHSVFRVQEDRRVAQRTCNVRYRRHVCFSQALTSAVIAIVAKLWCQKSDATFLHILLSIGPLFLFESLLSCHGDELDMWGDMIVAIEDLRSVRFTLVNHVKGEPIVPRVVGSRASLGVHIPVPDSVFSLLPLSYRPSFHITPVFFNIGILESITLAETLGTGRSQQRSNMDNFERLNDYCCQFRKLNLIEASATLPKRGFMNPQKQPSISELIEQLKMAIESNKSKNVKVLDLSSQIARRLKGLKFTSCKSAKDRTGMAVTLEQCNILRREYDLADNEFQRALDCMRSEGCRRENTYKNVGVRKYAFNGIQRLTLPSSHRPPAGTFGSVQS